MEEPRLEDYGITQGEFQQYQNRTTYLSENFYFKYFFWSCAILLAIVTTVFYYNGLSEEYLTIFVKTGAIFTLIFILFFVGFISFFTGAIVGVFIGMIIQSIDSYFYTKISSMYSKIKEYKEAKEQYDLYLAKREKERSR
jgi:hypothetical protein